MCLIKALSEKKIMNEVFPITPFTDFGANRYCAINEKIHLLFELTNDKKLIKYSEKIL